MTGVLTNGSGDYSFTGLAPGNYIVRVDQDNFDAGGTALSPACCLPGHLARAARPGRTTSTTTTTARAPPASRPSASAITLAYNTEPTAGTGNDTNNTLDFGFFTNPPPVLANLAATPRPSPKATRRSCSTPGARAATVTDDQANLNGGSLTVSITANEVAAEDVLGISVTAGDTVTLSNGTNVGSTVSVGGTAIGTIAAGGTGPAPTISSSPSTPTRRRRWSRR